MALILDPLSAALSLEIKMQNSFPIWDRTGTHILLDDHGREVWLDEYEARVAIGKQQVGVMRPKGRSREDMKLFLKESESSIPKGQRRIQMPQPNCVKIPVGDTHRAYMHVAERCESHYDGRQMPYVKYNHCGKPHTRGSYGINRQYL
jgi:hypothetical protein